MNYCVWHLEHPGHPANILIEFFANSSVNFQVTPSIYSLYLPIKLIHIHIYVPLKGLIFGVYYINGFMWNSVMYPIKEGASVVVISSDILNLCDVLSIFFRVPSLALEQLLYCSSTNEVTVNGMSEIHRYHTQQSKTNRETRLQFLECIALLGCPQFRLRLLGTNTALLTISE